MSWREIKEIFRECELKDVLAVFVGLPFLMLLIAFNLFCIGELVR